jgi:hypothetical protein
MEFVNKHPWMTFFLGLVALGTVSTIFTRRSQATAGLVGATFTPPQYGPLPQYVPLPQYQPQQQYVQPVQHRGGQQQFRGNILYRAQ